MGKSMTFQHSYGRCKIAADVLGAVCIRAKGDALATQFFIGVDDPFIGHRRLTRGVDLQSDAMFDDVGKDLRDRGAVVAGIYMPMVFTGNIAQRAGHVCQNIAVDGVEHFEHVAKIGVHIFIDQGSGDIGEINDRIRFGQNGVTHGMDRSNDNIKLIALQHLARVIPVPDRLADLYAVQYGDRPLIGLGLLHGVSDAVKNVALLIVFNIAMVGDG